MMAEYRSDDQLAADLSTMFTRFDPVPDAVRAAASASLSWRDPDAELAALIADSAAAVGEPVGVRGAPEALAGPRLLTFDAGEVSVDLEIEVGANRSRLVGQIASGWPARVAVEHATGSRSVEVDRLGRFIVADLPRGLLRVRVDPLDAAARPVLTEWFTA
jgi:hypothetical protein